MLDYSFRLLFRYSVYNQTLSKTAREETRNNPAVTRLIDARNTVILSPSVLLYLPILAVFIDRNFFM